MEHDWTIEDFGVVELKRSFKGGSPGRVVMGEDSCSRGCGCESQHWILDGHFSHSFVEKIVFLFVWKDRKLTKKPFYERFIQFSVKKINHLWRNFIYRWANLLWCKWPKTKKSKELVTWLAIIVNRSSNFVIRFIS